MSLYDASKCELQIGTLPVLDFVHEIKIDSSWQKFTDTAVITMPRKIRFLEAGAVKELPDLIQVGDPVTIKYGYDGELRQEFTGFVSALKPGAPFQIECEDAMWLFKRGSLNKAWRDVTLRQLLEYVLEQYGLNYPIQEIGDLHLGKYTIKAATGAQVFESLKSQFGLRCFFRNGNLVAGDPYQVHGTPARHRYAFRGNIIKTDELTFANAADVALHFRGISYLKDGKKIEVDEYGDVKNGTLKAVKGATKANVTGLGKGYDKGELRTITAVNLNEAQLRAYVQAEAKRLRYDGYRGGLVGFGLPACEHGDVAIIEDPDYPERAGEYYIDSVVKTFGVGGSRREIKIGPKAK